MNALHRDSMCMDTTPQANGKLVTKLNQTIAGKEYFPSLEEAAGSGQYYKER